MERALQNCVHAVEMRFLCKPWFKFGHTILSSEKLLWLFMISSKAVSAVIVLMKDAQFEALVVVSEHADHSLKDARRRLTNGVQH